MKKKRLIFIIPSLAKGGAERVVATLSKALIHDFEIFILIYHEPVKYDICGKLINLKTPTGSLCKKIKNIWIRTSLLKKAIAKISDHGSKNFTLLRIWTLGSPKLNRVGVGRSSTGARTIATT